MASRLLTDLDPRLQPLCREFLAQCAAQGIKAGVDCTYRSEAEQNDDYAKGRTAPGSIITNAQGGQSAHNCTLPDGTPAARAFDIYIQNPDGSLNWNTKSLPWEQAGEIGRSLGLQWGGDFNSIKDFPHFELKDWHEDDAMENSPHLS